MKIIINTYPEAAGFDTTKMPCLVEDPSGNLILALKASHIDGCFEGVHLGRHEASPSMVYRNDIYVQYCKLFEGNVTLSNGTKVKK